MIKFFKRGSGELLGFVICMPAFVWLLLYLVSLAQLAIAKEQLSYLTYSAGRAAVVAENYEDALKNANDVINASEDLSNYEYKTAEILINGSVPADPSNVAWSKGIFITVTVTCNVDLVLDFLDGERSANIVMMVERPANMGS